MAGGARSPYAAAVALEQWFRFGGGFVYDQHPPKPPAGVAPLEDFVAHTKRGYCQHFAGAMALMLRYLGIPSRVAVGFASGNYRHGEWVVSDRDAHTWVEVWFRGWGWVPFDPTPGAASGLAGSYSASSPSFDVTAATAVLAGKKDFEVREHAGEPRSASGRRPVPRRTCRCQGLLRRSWSRRAVTGRDWGILRLLALAIAGAVVLLVLAKLLRRGSRFLTRDPRRLAAPAVPSSATSCSTRAWMSPASATLRELAALVESSSRSRRARSACTRRRRASRQRVSAARRLARCGATCGRCGAGCGGRSAARSRFAACSRFAQLGLA